MRGTLNLPLLSISRESNSGLKGCVSSNKNLHESVGKSSVIDLLKRFLLSADHSPSLSDGLCQPVPVLL